MSDFLQPWIRSIMSKIQIFVVLSLDIKSSNVLPRFWYIVNFEIEKTPLFLSGQRVYRVPLRIRICNFFNEGLLKTFNTSTSKTFSSMCVSSRSYSYRDKYTWIRLYKVYVRPLLEYCVQAWSPWLKSNIEMLESVQKRILKMTSGLHSTSYLDKLKEVNLTTLEERRVKRDSIQT